MYNIDINQLNKNAINFNVMGYKFDIMYHFIAVKKVISDKRIKKYEK